VSPRKLLCRIRFYLPDLTEAWLVDSRPMTRWFLLNQLSARPGNPLYTRQCPIFQMPRQEKPPR